MRLVKALSHVTTRGFITFSSLYPQYRTDENQMPIRSLKVKFVKYAQSRVLSKTRSSDPPPTVPQHNNYPIISHTLPRQFVGPIHRTFPFPRYSQLPLRLNLFDRRVSRYQNFNLPRYIIIVYVSVNEHYLIRTISLLQCV